MLDIKNIISKSAIFQPVPDQDKDAFIHAFEKGSYERAIAPGEILTCAKDPAQLYFLLEKGTLLAEYSDGRSFVTNSCGDFLGPGLLCDKSEYTATTIVLEEGLVHVIDRDTIMDFMEARTLEADICLSAVDHRAGFLKEKAV